MSIPIWAIPLTLFLVLFIPSIMVQSHYLYKQKADKVDELNRKELCLIVESGNNQYFCPKIGDTNKMVARIGLRALGVKTIENVVVTLSSIDGKPNQNSSSFLNPVSCLPNETAIRDINPGDVTGLIEVFVWDKTRPNDPVYICYHQNQQNEIKNGNRTSGLGAIPCNLEITGKNILELKATGKDTNQVKQDFIIEIVGGDLKWYEAPKNNPIKE